MPKQEPPVHRLRHEEGSLSVPVDLQTLSMGDTFVREGDPCMVIGPSDFTEKNPFVVPNRVWIVNLSNGNAWPASGKDQVYPAFNVKLTFDTTRRDS